jgi:hypothetical protein
MSVIQTKDLILPTDLGPVFMTVTSLEHMHVFTNNDQSINVRGIRYRIGLHLNLYDGVWSLSRNKSGQPEYHYLSAKKSDAIDFNNIDASESARNKILVSVGNKVNEWVKTETAAKVFAQVELDDLELKMNSVKDWIEKLQKDLKTEKANLLKLEKSVVAARNALFFLTKSS